MNLRIDRLTLRVAGVSGPEGRRLALLVGDRLADAPPIEPAATARLAVTLDARRGETLDAMAQRIVEAMLRAAGRAL